MDPQVFLAAVVIILVVAMFAGRLGPLSLVLDNLTQDQVEKLAVKHSLPARWPPTPCRCRIRR